MDLVELADLEGLITPEAGVVLAGLAAEVPSDHAIVEVGSYKGKSTCYLAAGARQGVGARVWAVDAWDTPGNETGRFGFAEPETFEAFMHQCRSAGLDDRILPLKGHSPSVAALWDRFEDALPIGLLFIDGDHRAKSVRDDFRAWAPHLAARAVVVFDDLDTPRNPGVRVVVDELVASGALTGLEVLADRLGVGRYWPT